MGKDRHRGQHVRPLSRRSKTPAAPLGRPIRKDILLARRADQLQRPKGAETSSPTTCAFGATNRGFHTLMGSFVGSDYSAPFGRYICRSSLPKGMSFPRVKRNGVFHERPAIYCLTSVDPPTTIPTPRDGSIINRQGGRTPYRCPFHGAHTVGRGDFHLCQLFLSWTSADHTLTGHTPNGPHP